MHRILQELTQKTPFLFKLDILHIGVVVLITFLVNLVFSVIGVDPQHDGIILKPAIDVSRGLIPFKETFSQYGALTLLLQSFTIKIFGEYLLALKILTVVTYSIASIFLWVIWNRILPKSLSTVSCFLWLLVAPYYSMTYLAWSSVYAILFQLLTLYAIIKFLEDQKYRFIFFGGVFAACTFWTRKPVGLLLFGAVFLFFILLFISKRERLKTIGKTIFVFFSGYIIVTGLFIIWLLAIDAWNDWWLQSFKFIAVFNEQYGIKFDSLGLKDFYGIYRILLSSEDDLIWSIFPFCTCVIFVKILINMFLRKTNPKDLILLVCICVSLASWAQYYPVVGFRHFFWAATPMVGLLVWFIWDVFKSENKIYRLAAFSMIVVFIFKGPVKSRIVSGYQKISASYVQIEKPEVLKGMYLNPELADCYKKMTADMNYYLGNSYSNIITTSMHNALFLTFAKEHQNFHPMYVKWPILETLYPEYPNILKQYLDDRTPLIINDSKDTVGGYVGVRQYCDNIILMLPIINVGANVSNL
jgi:hypothetical protein